MLGLRLRSLFFNVGWYVGSTIIAIVGMPILLLSRSANIAWANVWIDFCLWWVKVTCRITHRVQGFENRPAGPVILACKHQSSWETLAFHRLFPNAATVLKRELLFIPVVGWAMARAGNIAVERGDGPKALRSLLRQAKATVAEGRSILIYPEGTRTPVGSSLPYHAGTAALYRQLGCRSCRWRSTPACSGGAASSSNGPALSRSRSWLRSRRASTARPSWRPCASASKGRPSGSSPAQSGRSHSALVVHCMF